MKDGFQRSSRSDWKLFSFPFYLSKWPGVHICPSHLLKDFPDEEVPAEGKAVVVELFEYEGWVIHHFFAHEDVKTLVPGKEGVSCLCEGTLLSVGDPR